MPQLSTTYIFLIYSWTWLVLCLISQNIKTVPINKTPTNTPPTKPQEPTLIQPWT